MKIHEYDIENLTLTQQEALDFIAAKRITYIVEYSIESMFGDIEDAYFIQVDGDDQGYFHLFMLIYKIAHPETDLTFLDDMDSCAECSFDYAEGSESSKDQLAFLELIEAIEDV